jgi:cytochrome b subunit of formate dehydrogenase
MVLWLQRALRERKHIQAALRPVSGRWYRRWPWSYRAIHLTLVFSFLLLALTGLPLRFHDSWWSPTLYSLLGGPASVRILHRIGAVLTFAYALAFVGMIVGRRLRGERGMLRGPNTLLPRMKDLRDIKDNVRWFLKGGPMPRFDRWTYWEKFDFLAEAWGVLFIGFTGLIMWFPIFFTGFLPGWGINLAHILHSYEALLATGFIFTMHFFNANLRPGKFPVDPLFLTGRISEEELRHERPAEYERMRAEGRLESEALPPPNERLQKRARVIGTLLLCVGITLLLLMASTMFL